MFAGDGDEKKELPDQSVPQAQAGVPDGGQMRDAWQKEGNTINQLPSHIEIPDQSLQSINTTQQQVNSYDNIPEINQFPEELLYRDPAHKVEFFAGTGCPVKSCRLYGASFDTPDMLMYHWNMFHWTKTFQWVCRYCSHRQYSADAMLQHLLDKHPDSKASNTYTVTELDANTWWCENPPHRYVDPGSVWIDFERSTAKYGVRPHIPPSAFDRDVYGYPTIQAQQQRQDHSAVQTHNQDIYSAIQDRDGYSTNQRLDEYPDSYLTSHGDRQGHNDNWSLPYNLDQLSYLDEEPPRNEPTKRYSEGNIDPNDPPLPIPTQQPRLKMPDKNQYPVELLGQDPEKEVQFKVGRCPIEDCSSGRKFNGPDEMEDHFNNSHWTKTVQWVCRRCNFQSQSRVKIKQHITTQHEDSVTATNDIIGSPPSEYDAYFWWCVANPRYFVETDGVWVDFRKHMIRRRKRSLLPPGCFDETLIPDKEDKAKENIPEKNEYPREFLNRNPMRRVEFVKDMKCPVVGCNVKSARPCRLEEHWNRCHFSKTCQWICQHCNFMTPNLIMIKRHLAGFHPECAMPLVEDMCPPSNVDAYAWWCWPSKDSYMDPKGVWLDFEKTLQVYGELSLLPPGCFNRSLQPFGPPENWAGIIYIPLKSEYPQEILNADPQYKVEFTKGMKCPIKQCRMSRKAMNTVAQFEDHWNNYHWSKTCLWMCKHCPFICSNRIKIKNHIVTSHRKCATAKKDNRRPFGRNPEPEDAKSWWCESYRNMHTNPNGVWIDFEAELKKHNETSFLPTDAFEEYHKAKKSKHVPGTQNLPLKNLYPAELLNPDPTKEMEFVEGMKCPVEACPTKISFSKVTNLEDHWNSCHWTKNVMWICCHCPFTTHALATMRRHLAKQHPDINKSTDPNKPVNGTDAYFWWGNVCENVYIDPKGVWVNFEKYFIQNDVTSLLPEGAFANALSPNPIEGALSNEGLPSPVEGALSNDGLTSPVEGALSNEGLPIPMEATASITPLIKPGNNSE